MVKRKATTGFASSSRIADPTSTDPQRHEEATASLKIFFSVSDWGPLDVGANVLP